MPISKYIPNKTDASGNSNWQEGQYVTAGNMNHIEDGIADGYDYADQQVNAAKDTLKTLTGSGDPTTSTAGTVGQKYLNTATKDIFICVNTTGSYTWTKLYKWNSTDSKYYLVDSDGDSIDVSAINAAIAAAESEAEQGIEDLSKALANPYDSAMLYSVGALCTYENKLYRAKAAGSGHVPTNTTYWEEVTVATELQKKANTDGSYSGMTVGLAEGIATDRIIDDSDVSCPPIVFGTTGGEAEIQTGNNKFELLLGNSRKWNQLFPLETLSASDVGVTITKDSSTGIYTFNGTASANKYLYIRMMPAECNGHKILILVNKISGTGSISVKNGNSAASIGNTIFTASGSFPVDPYIENGTAFSNYKVAFQMFDLTAMGREDITSVAQFKAEYPLAYYDYNESTILSSKAASLISTGRNQWNEGWETGYYSTTYGTPTADSNYIRSKNTEPIKVIPGETYCFTLEKYHSITVSHHLGTILFYDANDNYLGSDDVVSLYRTNNNGVDKFAATFEVPENAYFMRFYMTDLYGSTYDNDICIYINWDTPGLPYVAHRSQTVTLPNIELRSVGDVRDEAYASGGGKRKVGVKTFNGTESWSTSSSTYYSSLPSVAGSKKCINTKSYTVVETWSECNTTDKTCYIGGTNEDQIYIHDSSFANATAVQNGMNGQTFFYELATETDISTSENPGWTELVYTDNYGTLEFTTDPAQIPQVPQAYYIEYTISLTEYLDSLYTRGEGSADNIATEQEIQDILGGNTPAGKAVLADNLESNNKSNLLSTLVFDKSPTGYADNILMDKIIGGDVAFNQLADAPTTSSTGWAGGSSFGTYSITNNKITVVCNASAETVNQQVITQNIPVIGGHKYLVSAIGSANINDAFLMYGSTASLGINGITVANGTGVVNLRCYKNGGFASQTTYSFYLMVIDLTQMFGTAIANYLYGLSNNGGVNKFRLLFPKAYYPYNAGELLSVKTSGRKSVGINQWDEEWEVGSINSSTGQNSTSSTQIRSKNYNKCIPNAVYYMCCNDNNYAGIRFAYYDDDKNFISLSQSYYGNGDTFTIPAGVYYFRFFDYSGNTYHNDICINISDSSINGTFYPYVENTYPVEEVALHGVFGLDSNNNIVADGDEYTPDGKVKRRFANLTLTEDSVSLAGSDTYTNVVYYKHPKPQNYKYYNTPSSNGVKMLKYPEVYAYSTSAELSSWDDSKAIGLLFTGFYYGDFVFGFAKGTTLAQAKAALKDIPYTYELADASQTEDTATPYASTQAKGTTQQWLEPEWEEGETDIMVPVCQSATYLADLKKKLEESADMPSSDGTYVLVRSGGNCTYTGASALEMTTAEYNQVIAALNGTN